jgi:hypothetical protein
MKTSPKSNPKHSRGQIQYTHVLTQSKEEPPVRSMVGIHAFRVPWAPLKSPAEGGLSCLDQAPGLPSQPTVALPVATSATGTGPEPLGRKLEGAPAASFELVLEAIRQRHETKTAILEEALQRSESSQQRFWGINE